MKKLVLIALMAMPFVVSGMTGQVNATPSTIEFAIQPEPIDSRLVDALLHEVEQESGLSYDYLKTCYNCGNLTIEQTIEGNYMVALAEADGGILILLGEQGS